MTISQRLTPPQLPKSTNRAEVAKLCDLFKLCEKKFARPQKFIIYGSVAVQFYLADLNDQELPFVFETNDIDVHQGCIHQDILDQLNEFILESEQGNHVLSPEFRQTDMEMWPIHPDWRDSLVNLSDLIGTTLFEVYALHPLDLIISKLARFNGRDQEDSPLIWHKYKLCPKIASERLHQALLYLSATDNSKIRKVIENFYWYILDQEIPDGLVEDIIKSHSPHLATFTLNEE